jgi:predicted small lipoprotein YifL
MLTLKRFSSVMLCAAISALAGCGGSPQCGPVGLNVTPATTTVDHNAAPPANSQKLSATFQFSGNPGCPGVTAALVNSNWTVSDPSVHLSAQQATQVIATCTAAVAAPVTITATPVSGEMFTGQASLTCN